MDDFTRLLNGATNYPRNLARNNTSDDSLESYFAKINEHQNSLFTSERNADLGFCELRSDGEGSFVCAAGHARACLQTTRDMLMLAFTYFQVMPEFLDFLLLFGEQEHAQDLYCSGFYQRTRLIGLELSTKADTRNWSGRDMQVCYSLKSVESSPSQEHWPWSIRHCAVHHSFDAEHVRSTWLIIKGDNLIERRINSATSEKEAPIGKSAFETIERAFGAALTTHLILCDWSAEKWRWYIKFLEEKFEKLTGETITTNAGVLVSPTGRTHTKKLHHPETLNTVQTAKPNRIFSFTSSVRVQTQEFENRPITPTERILPTPIYVNPGGKKQPMPPGWKGDIPETPSSPSVKRDKYGQQIFSFEDLQDIQHLKEKANETVLVLRLNLNVIMQLKQHYVSITECNELPEDISSNCKWEMSNFRRRIDGITKNLELQILRVESLVCSLTDRKTLLYGLLDYQNTLASKELAVQSSNSTQEMKHMTREMKHIARRTKTETVSMKIITVVTLFFLPGTFISTLMSTEIVQWPEGKKVYQQDALNTWLYLSLPFMAVTLGLWGALHLYARRNEDKKEWSWMKNREKLPV
ncbi:MAG: hypothetical protein ASARMPRED_001238 [Alectoria sarmentosa]|nr:MAG: hypothetical protein ASARMPRED_001238 [Alectoria sarmentosa]